jgi:hypothetical protein
VQESPLRSSAIAPGPGGVGFQLARRAGDAGHYIAFPTEAGALSLEQSLVGTATTPLRRGDASSGAFWVDAWHRDASTAARWYPELRRLASESGGWYDGGEVVDGVVWGPHGPT